MSISPRAEQNLNGIANNSLGLQVFATCPASASSDPLTYRQRVQDVARWSEAIGCRGNSGLHRQLVGGPVADFATRH